MKRFTRAHAEKETYLAVTKCTIFYLFLWHLAFVVLWQLKRTKEFPWAFSVHQLMAPCEEAEIFF
jgi:hypothetical protein